MSQNKTDNLAKMYAFENLGENEESVRNGTSEVRNFIKEDADLDSQIISDKIILLFLRSCKFRVEQAKKKIKSYYTQHSEVPEWFHNRDPFETTLVELLDIGVFLPVLQADENNHQVVILRIAAHDPSKHKQNDVMKVSMMILDWLAYHNEKMSIYGIRAVFDMKNIRLGHALQMTPTIIKRAVMSMESYPVRIQKLEFVNANRGVNVVLDVFRSFMTQKLKDRITVSRHVPDFNSNDHLPYELGGSEGTYKDLAQHWKKLLQKNYAWFSD